MRQGELIPLTEDEIRLRGGMLARLTLELHDIRSEHADEKKRMRAVEEDYEIRIRRIARSIRDGSEESEK